MGKMSNNELVYLIEAVDKQDDGLLVRLREPQRVTESGSYNLPSHYETYKKELTS